MKRNHDVQSILLDCKMYMSRFNGGVHDFIMRRYGISMIESTTSVYLDLIPDSIESAIHKSRFITQVLIMEFM